jgi:hypothetical protein
MDTQRFNHMVMALVVNANHVFAETIMCDDTAHHSQPLAIEIL